MKQLKKPDVATNEASGLSNNKENIMKLHYQNYYTKFKQQLKRFIVFNAWRSPSLAAYLIVNLNLKSV